MWQGKYRSSKDFVIDNHGHGNALETRNIAREILCRFTQLKEVLFCTAAKAELPYVDKYIILIFRKSASKFHIAFFSSSLVNLIG